MSEAINLVDALKALWAKAETEAEREKIMRQVALIYYAIDKPSDKTL